MEKEYVYISQEDLDKLNPVLMKRKINQKDAFGIPLEFAVDFWGKDSPQGKIAMIQQGFNTEGTGTIDLEIESAIFSVINEQKEKNICFSSLAEAMDKMTSNDGFHIVGSFDMGMNIGMSSHEFIQLETDSFRCVYNGETLWLRIVMGMSTSKMFISMGELYEKIKDTPLDIWGRIFKFDNDPEPPSFQFKPFVVGFNWISSMD